MTGTLFDEPGTLEAAFYEFNEACPDVYEHLRRMALGVLYSGRSHYTIAKLYEDVRLHVNTTAHHGAAPIRLNNNHRAFYARKLMAEVPELAGFFRTRSQRAAA